MESCSIVKISDNIISPLGFTALENYAAIKSGKSALRQYKDKWNIPEPFVASLFEDDSIESAFAKISNKRNYTKFEMLAIMSAAKAIEQTNIDVSSPRVQFIISTTKGNVNLLYEKAENIPANAVYLGVSANRITSFFKNPNLAIVVSNACISGLNAQIAAMRCLLSGRCDYAIVVGADCQSKFIVSGFQSFKALSPENCKPFDKNRAGLNLGEAAGTIIYAPISSDKINSEDWIAAKGAIRNDANHISGPSRTGEGSYRALRAAVGNFGVSKIAFINAHGTATAYNDEMEAVAISRAGLSSVAVNSMKGYYGHTMGAAGVIESILSMHAVDDNTIVATRGFEQCGVSQNLILSNQNAKTDKKAFVKLLSGFGGCNAALLFAKGGAL